MSSTLIDGEKGLATSSSSATAVNIAPTQAEKINVEHDSEASIGAPEQGRCYCSPEDKRIMRYSALLIVAFVWPFCVGLLMGLYYLYDKYGSELVNAFAIIWCVFIACLLTGLTYTYRQRVRDAKIASDQAIENERLAAERVVQEAQRKAEAAEQKRAAARQAAQASASAQ